LHGWGDHKGSILTDYTSYDDILEVYLHHPIEGIGEHMLEIPIRPNSGVVDQQTEAPPMISPWQFLALSLVYIIII
jgi:hypothetical protein